MNMPCVNVSLDVRAAMNAYLLTWNELEVITHLGSFHFLKENFQVSVENMWWSIFEWLFTSSLRNFWYNFLDRSRGTSDAVSTLFIEDVFWVDSSGANYPYYKHQNLLGILLGNVCTCVRKNAPLIYIICFHIFFRLIFRSLEHCFVTLVSKMLYSLQTSPVQEVSKVSLQDHTIIEHALFTKFSKRHSNDFYSIDSWLEKNHTLQHLHDMEISRKIHRKD